MCPRVPKRDQIELLECLLVSLGGSEGDPGAPKWCLGCPWGGAKWGLQDPWGALGGPSGDPGVTIVEKGEGDAKLGTSFWLHFWSFWNNFSVFLRLCFGYGFRHGFTTHFRRKKEKSSADKKTHLVTHMVKLEGIDEFCLVMSCLVLSSCLV